MYNPGPVRVTYSLLTVIGLLGKCLKANTCAYIMCSKTNRTAVTEALQPNVSRKWCNCYLMNKVKYLSALKSCVGSVW